MPKANAGDNSSLELLLDTMCNTFGAVMFIAMWKRMNSTRKQPVTLITNFLPREELVKKQLIMFEFCLFLLKISSECHKDRYCLPNNNAKPPEK